MSASALYMSLSLDEYIAGPSDRPGNPDGEGVMRLHEWYGFGQNGPDPSDVQSAEKSVMGQHFLAEGNATGAVLEHQSGSRVRVQKA